MLRTNPSRRKSSPAANVALAILALMLLAAIAPISGTEAAADERWAEVPRTAEPEPGVEQRGPGGPDIAVAVADVRPPGNCTTVTVGVGSPSPSSDILAWIDANYANGGTRDFDVAGNDQYFAHTFDLFIPTGQVVVWAQLDVAATVGDGLGSNDAVRIGDFLNGPAGGGSMTGLGYPQGVPTVQPFDLSALPSGVGTVSLHDAMTTSAQLDVVVQDDTMVDYLRLIYCTAPDVDCTTVFIGTGSPTPSTNLASWIAANYPVPGIRDFDVAGADRYFAHTFGIGVPAGYNVISGSLTISATVGDDLGSNDTVRIGNVPGGPSGADQLIDLGFVQGGPGVVTLDLNALPPSGTTSVLNVMQSTGELDVTIQDDTMVDALELEYCVAPRIVCFTAFAGAGTPTPAVDILDHIDVTYAYPGTRDFDVSGSDAYFAHTFALTIPATYSVVSGSVDVAATLGGSNDMVWMGDYPNHPFGGGGLLGLGYPMNTPHVTTFNMNSLMFGSSTLSVLNAMTVAAELDIVIQDDTLVDYLDLEYCTSRKTHGPIPHVDPAKEFSEPARPTRR